MRNVKGLLAISFHQPKALPPPRAHVNFHLAVQLPHLVPSPAADGAQTHRPPLPSAPGRLRRPPGPSSGPPGPRFRLPPARYFTRAGGWSGSGSGRGELALHHCIPPLDWEGVKWRWLPSLNLQSAAMGSRVSPLHSPCNNLGRKMGFERWGGKKKNIGFASR